MEKDTSHKMSWLNIWQMMVGTNLERLTIVHALIICISLQFSLRDLDKRTINFDNMTFKVPPQFKNPYTRNHEFLSGTLAPSSHIKLYTYI